VWEVTITRVGTNQKYAEGWESAFGGKSGGTRSSGAKAAKKPAKKAPAKKAKKGKK